MSMPAKVGTLAAVLVFLAAGCTMYREQADRAAARGDWDEAIDNYERALDSAKPEEIPDIQARLSEARRNSFENHSARGRAAFAAGDWYQAVSHLERAQELSPDIENARLLGQARAKAAEAHRQDFARLYPKARAAMSARDWAGASALYQGLEPHGSTVESERESAFCEEMRLAEASTSDPESALPHYRTALASGIDSEYVRGRMLAVTPRSYTLTIHRAAILPFKPVTHETWDGSGPAVANAADYLARLSRLGDRGGGVYGEIVRMSAGAGDKAVEPPDCYLEVRLGDEKFGGEQTIAEDEVFPQWEFQVRFRATATDSRVLSVVIRDRDAPDSEEVASVEIPLTELLGQDGVQERRYFDRRGRLRAGGLLALVVSVVAND